MNENYLHQIWKNKRLPFHLLKLVSGQEFKLIHQGYYNRESGPDFFCGQVEINSIHWIGNIEIHVKSSDWYLHNHQVDRAYDNVILHVVFENDKQVLVNGVELPTLELKNYLDSEHFMIQSKVKIHEINCFKLIQSLDSIYLETMKSKVIVDRINRKSELIAIDSIKNMDQVLFTFLAHSFGNKVNTFPFIELTNRINIKILKRINEDDIQIIIFGIAGFYNSQNIDDDNKIKWEFYKQKYDLSSMDSFQWKMKGVRPDGFPLKRLVQLSHFIKHFNFNIEIIQNSSIEIIDFIESFFQISTDLKKWFSKSFIDLIIINGYLPFIWWYSKRINDDEMKKKVLEILTKLKSESNYIIEKWKLIGVNSKKAYDSQALLEIYNQFCINNKCLSCTVGNKLLNS
jgi:hypothetical protein